MFKGNKEKSTPPPPPGRPSLVYKRHVVFLRKICSFPRITRKPFQALPSILQAENRVEIHYDSLDLYFKTTAIEKKLVAKILSMTHR